MCLLVVAWKTHPRYRLLVAANRDEFHDRPAAPLGWWNNDPRVLAGRDLKAGGAWLGVARSGRFGIVTNFRDLESAPAPDAPSRGSLVPAFLTGAATPEEFFEGMRGSAQRFAGFNLLVGGPDSLHYVSNRSAVDSRPLARGIYGLSNHSLDSPWPKLVRTRQKFTRLIDRDEPDAAAMFDILADRETAPDSELPHSGLPLDWERALSAPFVLHGRYGTRCSTVMFVRHDGRTVVQERRFDSSGRETGVTRLEFTGAATTE